MAKNLIFASMGMAGLVALMAILDLVLKIPFAGYSMVLDIMLLLSALLVGYLSWDSYRENR